MEPHPHNHAANAMALVAPTTSWILHAPDVITSLLGIMGICWYAISFYEKWRHYKKRKHNQYRPEQGL